VLGQQLLRLIIAAFNDPLDLLIDHHRRLIRHLAAAVHGIAQEHFFIGFGILERAEHINPAALGDGSVYTSLGSLYAQVPGFPVGFGDPVKARAYLSKALKVNPSGIDPNFFYGDFLARQGDNAGAVKALEHALAAPPRPGHEVADRGRRAEVSALLAQTKRKLNG
jgi:tetratricopeptide (TPR) repeat protein